jgi:Putative transposase, YhgA-like
MTSECARSWPRFPSSRGYGPSTHQNPSRPQLPPALFAPPNGRGPAPVYQGLFYQQLVDHGALTPEGLLPPVFSVVVYNGKANWSAAQELGELVCALGLTPDDGIPRMRYRLLEMEACRPEELKGNNLVALLIRLERSTDRASLQSAIGDLVKAVRGPGEGGLRRAFVVWLQHVLLPARGEEDIPELVDLKEFRAMLSERVEEWSRQIEARSRKKGRREGLKIGRAEGQEVFLRQLEIKFGPLDEPTRSRVKAARPQSLLAWAERLVTADTLADVFGP